jgi:hypothetical protein
MVIQRRPHSAEVIELIPEAFRFPEMIECRITYDNLRILSPGYRESPYGFEAALRLSHPKADR